MQNLFFIFSRFLYQICSFIFFSLSLTYLPELAYLIVLRPIFSFICNFSTLNLESAYIKLYLNKEDFFKQYKYVLTAKNLLLLFILPLAGSVYYYYSKPDGGVLLYVVGLTIYGLITLLIPLQTIKIKLNGQTEFAIKVFIILSLLYVSLTLSASNLDFENKVSVYLIIILISFITIYLNILKTINFKFIFNTFTYYKNLLLNSIDTSVLSNTANLIELLPYIILSTTLSIKEASALSLSFQLYYTAFVFPFNFLVRKKFIINKFPKSFSPKKVIYLTKNIIFGSLFFVIAFESFAYLINLKDFTFLDEYQLLIKYSSLMIISLPITIMRGIFTFNIYSSKLTCIPLVLIFILFSIIIMLIPKNNLIFLNPLACILCFEILFIFSIITGSKLFKRYNFLKN